MSRRSREGRETAAPGSGTPDGVRLPRRRRPEALLALRLGDAAGFVLRRCWTETPGRLAALVLADALLALGPSAQVLTITALIRRADEGWQAWALPLVLLVALMGAAQVVGQVAGALGGLLAVTLRRALVDDLARTAARLPPRRLADPDTTARLAAARDGLAQAAGLPFAALSGVAAVLTAVSLCVTVAGIDPLAGVLVAAALVPAVALLAWQGRRRDATTVAYGRESRLSVYALEQLVGRASGTELLTLGSGHVVAEIADGHRLAATRIREAMYRRFAGAGALAALATSALLGAALLAILTGSGSGAPVAAGVVGVLAGLDAILYAGGSLGQTVAQSHAVMVYRGLDASGGAAAAACDRPIERLALDDVGVTYAGAARPSLEHVSLHAARGEMVALVGANGAGKSTAIRVLLGLLDLDAGRVMTTTARGADAAPPSPEQVGLLTQEFGRYEFTVRDAVRLGRPDGRATDAELWAALAAAHVDDVVRGLPHGLDSRLGEQSGGTGLSGGQWQRLALARIHLRAAPVWILDEPTSAIDAEAEQRIFDELGATRGDRITLVVSHRAWTLKAMDRIYVLDGGRVVETGTFDELLVADGRFTRLFRQQLTSAGSAGLSAG